MTSNQPCGPWANDSAASTARRCRVAPTRCCLGAFKSSLRSSAPKYWSSTAAGRPLATGNSHGCGARRTQLSPRIAIAAIVSNHQGFASCAAAHPTSAVPFRTAAAVAETVASQGLFPPNVLFGGARPTYDARCRRARCGECLRVYWAAAGVRTINAVANVVRRASACKLLKLLLQLGCDARGLRHELRLCIADIG